MRLQKSSPYLRIHNHKNQSLDYKILLVLIKNFGCLVISQKSIAIFPIFIINSHTGGFSSNLATLHSLYVAFPVSRTRRFEVYSVTETSMVWLGEWLFLTQNHKRGCLGHALWKFSDFAEKIYFLFWLEKCFQSFAQRSD